MADFTGEQVRARVQAKVRAGDFFFPEDLARAIARELGVDVSGTPFGKVAPENSPTRGEVPPFSGRPFSDEHATEHARAAVAAYDEKREESRETTRSTVHRPTKAEVFEEAGDPLEDAPSQDEVDEESRQEQADVNAEGGVQGQVTEQQRAEEEERARLERERLQREGQ